VYKWSDMDYRRNCGFGYTAVGLASHNMDYE
jgi:hypothetical protein